MFTTGYTAHIDTILKFLPHTRQHGCFLLAQTPSFSKLFIPRLVLSVGGPPAYFARNARCTVTTDLVVRYSNTQNDFSTGAAIFSLHTLASPSGRNVNNNEKQLTGGKKLSLNAELIPICYLLELLAHHILHVSRVRVKGHFNPLNAELNRICHLLALLGAHHIFHVSRVSVKGHFNPLNAQLNPICHLLALLGAHHILHVSRIRVKGHFNPLNAQLNPICHLKALLGAHHILHFSSVRVKGHFNPLNAELNQICHSLALLGAHLILHVSRIRVNSYALLHRKPRILPRK